MNLHGIYISYMVYIVFEMKLLIYLSHCFIVIILILNRWFLYGRFILHLKYLSWSQVIFTSSMFNEHNLFGAYQIHGHVLTLNIMGLWKLPVSQSFLNSHSQSCKQIFFIRGLTILVIVKVNCH